MKKLLLTAFSVLSLSGLSAQITINSSDFGTAYAGTTDSLSIKYGALTAALNAGAGMTWNISADAYSIIDTPFIRHFTAPTAYAFEDYNYRFLNPNMYLNTRDLYTISATGLVQDGQMLDNKGYNLYAIITGAVPGDSIIFPAQTNIFTSPLIKLKLPANYGNNWQSNYVSDIQFTLTYSGVFNHTPGNYKAYTSQSDSVTGYGQVVVRDEAGNPSGPIDVLLVKTHYQQVDSFYLGGFPAPDSLLIKFNLAQGTLSNSYEYRFFRKGEVTPIVQVVFTDSSYTTADKTYTHTHNLPPYTAVPGLVNTTMLDFYPNPVAGGELFVNVPTNSGKWEYLLINSIGQTITSGTMLNSRISLPENTSPGLYYLRLNEDGKNAPVLKVTICR